jgi:hypothetical protein
MLFCQGGWAPAGMSRWRAGTESLSADKAARKGLSDRYPRKNQTFRQMPNPLPNPPKFAVGIGVEEAEMSSKSHSQLNLRSSSA